MALYKIKGNKLISKKFKASIIIEDRIKGGICGHKVIERVVRFEKSQLKRVTKVTLEYVHPFTDKVCRHKVNAGKVFRMQKVEK